eukprot:6611424-Alexandrium_andersonii.AAC.1
MLPANARELIHSFGGATRAKRKVWGHRPQHDKVRETCAPKRLTSEPTTEYQSNNQQTLILFASSLPLPHHPRRRRSCREGSDDAL